jgi:SHS2 domain-containing protein
VNTSRRGHREVEHTADWELEIWAEDLSGLLAEAARGMYELMGVEVSAEDRCHRRLELAAEDHEGLLVAFLGELLYLLDSEDLAFDGFLVTVNGDRLDARLEGGVVTARGKEIKAVTFHRLTVRDTGYGFETRVVFDV